MPYAKSVKAIRRVESYLQKMVEASSNLHFPTHEPARLNHHIRDGIHAAELHVERFPEYARLKAKYIIRVKSNELFLELRDGNTDITEPKVVSSLSFPGITSLLSIIGVGIKHKIDELIFPDALLTEDDTMRLLSWAGKHGYKVIDDLGPGISLKKREPSSLSGLTINTIIEDEL